jgi:hypothetical protein
MPAGLANARNVRKKRGAYHKKATFSGVFAGRNYFPAFCGMARFAVG